MELSEKLRILADSAKYDASCASSGSVQRYGAIGNTSPSGCCHSFSEDGRCISLLKVLFTNYCVNDCKYCRCRSSNDIPRASFTPRELAELFIGFYKRNYVEGLFLSSGIVKDADYTASLLLKTLTIIRREYGFSGYIHVKAIPGASEDITRALGLLADRMSVNIELPCEESLKRLAPQKSREKILGPMGSISAEIAGRKNELALFKHAPRFVPAGQSTQMIIGATPDSDYRILRLTEGLYKKYSLKRVYFSAYIPVGDNKLLPAVRAPLLREHRLYQADWLLRFYHFKTEEIISPENPNLDPLLDPKSAWALKNLGLFPVEINSAPYETLLRVPGIGVTGAKRIVSARRGATLGFDSLKRLGIVLKRAAYFITCQGRYMSSAIKCDEKFIYNSLTAAIPPEVLEAPPQLSLFSGGAERISDGSQQLYLHI